MVGYHDDMDSAMEASIVFQVSTESVTYGHKKETLQLLFFSYHAHECQDQAQSGRDGEGEEGGELFSSCERCLLASGF